MTPRSNSAEKDEIEARAARWVARRDAGLSQAEQRDLQNWIDSDARHRTALEFFDSAWSALARPARIGAGDDLARELSAIARRRRQRRLGALGAVCVCLVLFGLMRGGRPMAEVPASRPTVLVVHPARQTLPDNSQVELKGNATIVVEYTPSLRRVVLTQGEAYFSVQKDPARPFVVAAAGVEVRAVGTAFSVQMRPNAVEVLVTNGRVAVAKSADSMSFTVAAPAAPAATVDAGSRAVVDIAPHVTLPEVTAVPAMELDKLLAWRSTRLEFTKTPLAEAVELINRHAAPTAPRLRTADASVAAMRVTGVFRADNIDGFVLLLEGAFGVKAERSAALISLRKAD